MCKYTVASNVHISKYEKPSPTSPGAKMSRKANWHRLPNWEHGHLGRVVKSSPASTRSPSGPKTSQMGVSYSATPEIYNFPPKIPPNVPNSEHNHPPATSGIVYIYLLAPPTPTTTVPPYYTPRPPIRHPRHINHPTCLPSGSYW